MKRLVSFILIFISSQLFAQNPYLLWEKTIGGSDGESPSQIVYNEPTGNVYLIGQSSSNTSFEKSEDSKGGQDIWIVKTTEGGTIIWDKTIGGNALDGMIVTAIIKEDLLYVLSSSTSTISSDKTAENYGLQDYWLVCLDFDGNVIWDKSYGGSAEDIANQLILIENGNLLLTGSSRSGISGNKTSASKGESDYWIVEVNPLDGSIIQQKSFGTNTDDQLFAVSTDETGNVYLVGTSTTGINGDKTDVGYGSDDIWIVKLDEDYTLLANKCFGGSALENPRGDVLVKNGFLYLFTDSESPISGNKTAPLYGYFDYWLLKIDENLNVVWDKSFGGSYWDQAYSIISQPSDKFVLSGRSQSMISGSKTSMRYGDSADIWMIIVDKDGNEVKQETYGGFLNDGASSVVGDDSGTLYMLAGSASNTGGLKTEDCRGVSDYWFLKLDASEFLRLENSSSENTLKVYPNPFTESVRFEFGAHHEPLTLTLYSIDGKIIFQTIIPSETLYFDWTKSDEEYQMLIYELRSNEFTITNKLVRTQ
jgi:hypothetical protein